MYPNPCPANWFYPDTEANSSGFDPYSCGDDLLLPKSEDSWTSTLDDGIVSSK